MSRLRSGVLAILAVICLFAALPATAQAPLGTIKRMIRIGTSITTTTPIRGTVILRPDVPESAGVVSVVFYLNGNGLGTVKAAPFKLEWDSTTSPDGEYSLKAIGSTATGEEIWSGEGKVTIANSAPAPAVTAAAPPVPPVPAAPRPTATIPSTVKPSSRPPIPPSIARPAPKPPVIASTKPPVVAAAPKPATLATPAPKPAVTAAKPPVVAAAPKPAPTAPKTTVAVKPVAGSKPTVSAKPPVVAKSTTTAKPAVAAKPAVSAKPTIAAKPAAPKPTVVAQAPKPPVIVPGVRSSTTTTTPKPPMTPPAVRTAPKPAVSAPRPAAVKKPTAPVADPSQINWKMYTNSKYGFVAEYPDTAKVQNESAHMKPKGPGSFWIAFTQTANGKPWYAINVRHMKTNEPGTPDKFARYNTYLLSWDRTDLAGMSGFKTISGRPSSKRVIHRTLLVDNQDVWMLNLTDVSGKDQNITGTIFQRFLQGFRLANGPAPVPAPMSMGPRPVAPMKRTGQPIVAPPPPPPAPEPAPADEAPPAPDYSGDSGDSGDTGGSY